MNTLLQNWPYFSSFIKRTAICILCIEGYLLFFIQFNHCEAMPEPIQPKLVNERKMNHILSDSAVVPVVSLVRHDKPTVVRSLDDRVQFWSQRINNFFGVIGSFVLGVPCVGEKVVKPDGGKNYQQSNQGDLSGDNKWLIQVILLLVVIPAISALITVIFFGST